jgi:cytochrome oxidase Cu insertion factor (SCO1/SenC/PrrC family)
VKVAFVGLAGLVAIAAVAAVLLLSGRDTTAAETPFAGASVPAGIELPSFSLEDERGRPVRSGDLHGKVAVITFLDAQCVDACPTIGSAVARGIDRLTPAERAQVAAVGISVDPAEDTVAARREFLARHRATGRLRYASASLRELTPLWRDFQVLATALSGDDSLHSAPVRIYSRDGEWLSTLYAGSTLTAGNLVHDLRLALARDG